MASDADDGPFTSDESFAPDGTGSPIVDRWITVDRGWQALALGLGVVAVHLAAQLTIAPF